MLEGDGCADADVEWTWMLSRVCQDFHCMPDAAEALLMDDDAQYAVAIMELRAYAAAKASFDAVGGKLEKLDQSPLMDMVVQNDARRVLRGR